MTWTLHTDVDAHPETVRRAIADEHALMAWSAWPAATGLRCAVEEGDGTSVGSTIVFRDPSGTEQGRQQLTESTADRVGYRLHNRGPFGRIINPELDFRIEPKGPAGAVVHLDFRAKVPLPAGPRHVVEALMGRRVRALHVADLRQLKDYAESA